MQEPIHRVNPASAEFWVQPGLGDATSFARGRRGFVGGFRWSFRGRSDHGGLGLLRSPESYFSNCFENKRGLMFGGFPVALTASAKQRPSASST
jgi:hypothetical protein